MKLFELMELGDFDEDTYDDTFDAIVTCVWLNEPGDELESYDQFCKEVYKRVNIVQTRPNTICNWAGFIYENQDVLAGYITETEEDSYEMADNIDCLHGFLSGGLSEDDYDVLVSRFQDKYDD